MVWNVMDTEDGRNKVSPANLAGDVVTRITCCADEEQRARGYQGVHIQRAQLGIQQLVRGTAAITDGDRYFNASVISRECFGQPPAAGCAGRRESIRVYVRP